jgi:hypothetical protein
MLPAKWLLNLSPGNNLLYIPLAFYLINLIMSKDYKDKYTKPKLREKIKEKLKNSTKGGKKGKWSARKSQLLVQEYEKKGGGYKQDENNKEANSLKEWTDQEWQTKEQEGKARKDGKMKRYLPKKVWENLSEKEKKKAEKLKVEADKKGKHKVKWTPAIKKAFEKAKLLDIKNRSKLDKKALKKKILEAELG